MADYMHLCLADPQYGYYQTKNAIGTSGDFITAPEISQMFGELIGVWCIDMWNQLGKPAPFTLAELGPGKGTLMQDLLRSANLAPDFLNAMNLVLVETSTAMRKTQAATLAKVTKPIHWQSEINTLPAQPTIIVANEFLDVIPFRQYVKTEKKWHERGIAVDGQQNFVNATLANSIGPEMLPEGSDDEPDGSIFEISPAREAIVEMLDNHIATNQGAALLIDYGHTKSGFGDTFQAMQDHRYVDPFTTAGRADLTSHIDFEALGKVTSQTSMVTTQSEFLIAMGLLERAGQLGADAGPITRDTLQHAVDRLAGADQMGSLFKVMCLHSNGLNPPGFGVNFDE